MYIQLTTRCNMTCEHCIFDCTTIGEDISLDNFEKACMIADRLGQNLTIGGGEPTLHDKFWYLLGHALTYPEMGIPYMVTNGSMTETSLRLVELRNKNRIDVRLSLDHFHEPIDDEVVAAFFPDSRDIKYFHYDESNLIEAGRAKKNFYFGPIEKQCVLDDLFVTPNGKVYYCGCKTHCFGTVDQVLADMSEVYSYENCCYRKRSKKSARAA